MSSPQFRTKDSHSSQLPVDVDKIRAFFEPYTLNIVCGVLFGFAFQRARIHEASLIVGQMSFSHLVMLKMFLTAVAVSMLSFYILPKFYNKPSIRACYAENFSRGTYGVAIGAGLLGVGMTLCGACPGTVFAQIGAGSISSFIVLIGGLVGAYVYGLYDAFCAKNPSFKDFRQEGKLPANKTYLENIIMDGKFTYEQLVLYISGGLLVFVCILELIDNWKSDISSIDPKATFWNAVPPIICGILVGLTQFLSNYLTAKPLGSSSSYSCIVANTMPVSDSPYHGKVRESHRYQLAMAIGIIAGSMVSSILSLRTYVGVDFSYLRLFLGGILIVFGGQFAAGCTSGHGLSGLGNLSTYSAIAVGAMFSAGILTRIVLAIFGY